MNLQSSTRARARVLQRWDRDNRLTIGKDIRSKHMSTPQLRKLWREYFRYRHRYVPFPEILRGMTCGAKTRAGTPCKQKGLYDSGRCKLHGGLSTGPTSPEGKARALLNLKHRKAAKMSQNRLRTSSKPSQNPRKG